MSDIPYPDTPQPDIPVLPEPDLPTPVPETEPDDAPDLPPEPSEPPGDDVPKVGQRSLISASVSGRRCGVAVFAGLSLPLGHGHAWGPQRPEKRLGNTSTDDGEGSQDEPNPAIERNSILAGPKTLQPSHVADNVDGLKLVANSGVWWSGVTSG
jgi:hypothetical protein